MTRYGCWPWLALMGMTWSAHAAQCTLTTTGLRFGALTPQAATTATALGTVVLTCRGTTGELMRYQLQLTRGQGSYRQRIMQSGAARLAYNLYLDADRTRIWGDGSEGTGELSEVVRLPGPVYRRLYPIYGRILSTGTVDAKPYVDTVLVQLSY